MSNSFDSKSPGEAIKTKATLPHTREEGPGGDKEERVEEYVEEGKLVRSTLTSIAALRESPDISKATSVRSREAERNITNQ